HPRSTRFPYTTLFRSYMDLRPEGDRVVILEDTDGDGLADKEITFYQGPELTNPLGICVISGPGGGKRGQRVIVSAAPNVWLLTRSEEHTSELQSLRHL